MAEDTDQRVHCALEDSEFNESEQARQEWTEEDDNGSSKYT